MANSRLRLVAEMSEKTSKKTLKEGEKGKRIEKVENAERSESFSWWVIILRNYGCAKNMTLFTLARLTHTLVGKERDSWSKYFSINLRVLLIFSKF